MFLFRCRRTFRSWRVTARTTGACHCAQSMVSDIPSETLMFSSRSSPAAGRSTMHWPQTRSGRMSYIGMWVMSRAGNRFPTSSSIGTASLIIHSLTPEPLLLLPWCRYIIVFHSRAVWCGNIVVMASDLHREVAISTSDVGAACQVFLSTPPLGMAYCLAKPGLALIQYHPWQALLQLLHTDTPSYLSERLHPYISSRTFDHPPPLTCTSLTLIFISVHARFILQPQQSGISPPSTLRSSETLNTCLKHLNTHLYQSVFNSL